MIEISHRGTLLHAKVCHSYNFWQICSQDLMISNLLKFSTRAHYYMLIKFLMCSYLPFIKFWNKFHPKIRCSPYLLKYKVTTSIWRRRNGTRYAYNIFHKKTLENQNFRLQLTYNINNVDKCQIPVNSDNIKCLDQICPKLYE